MATVARDIASLVAGVLKGGDDIGLICVWAVRIERGAKANGSVKTVSVGEEAGMVTGINERTGGQRVSRRRYSCGTDRGDGVCMPAPAAKSLAVGGHRWKASTWRLRGAASVSGAAWMYLKPTLHEETIPAAGTLALWQPLFFTWCTVTDSGTLAGRVL